MRARGREAARLRGCEAEVGKVMVLRSLWSPKNLLFSDQEVSFSKTFVLLSWIKLNEQVKAAKSNPSCSCLVRQNKGLFYRFH